MLFNNNMRNTNFNKILEKINVNLGQKGGGLTVDVGQQIAGQPVYQSYLDCSPPAILGGKLSSAKGCRPMCGGSARKLLKKLKKSKSKSRTYKVARTKRHSKVARRNKPNKYKTKTRKVSKSKGKSKKTSRTQRKKKRTTVRYQKGGNPGKYPFKGENSILTPGMSNRTFDCKQPSWDPKCT